MMHEEQAAEPSEMLFSPLESVGFKGISEAFPLKHACVLRRGYYDVSAMFSTLFQQVYSIYIFKMLKNIYE